MLPKSFVIIFITYVYTMYIPTMGSQRQHVFRVSLIRSNCAWLHNFFFLMIDYGENGYLHSKMWEKNDRKLIIGGVNMSWVEKNRKINNRWGEGGGRLFGTWEYVHKKSFSLQYTWELKKCFTRKKQIQENPAYVQ